MHVCIYTYTYIYNYNHTHKSHTHTHTIMYIYTRVVYAQMSRQSRIATLQTKMKETSVRKMHSVTVRSRVSSDIRIREHLFQY